jgi:hypothetical protein
MPHLPPAHHETSKHDSPHKTKVKEKQNKTVPDSNSNLAKSMTHHNQTKELTTWFLNLRVVEQWKRPLSSKERGGRLLFTEEVLLAWMKIRNGSSSNSSSRSNSNAKNSGKNKTAKSSVGNERRGSTGRDDICGYCGKKGH